MGGDLGIIDVLGLIVPLYFAYKKKGSRGFWLLLGDSGEGDRDSGLIVISIPE